jgi:O-antigen ligase
MMRIPSTFSFPAQYYNYLLCATMVAWVATHGERSRRWARFAWASMILAVLASVFSGVRAAFVFAPLLLLLAHLLKKDTGRLFGIFVTAALLIGAGLSIANVNWVDLGDFILGLAITYAGTNSVGYIAASASTFGWGVGSGTNAARYVLDLPLGQGQGPENFYAKAIYELGVPGLIAVVFLLLVTASGGIAQLRRLRNYDSRALCAGVVALEVTVMIYCFKGNFLDMDPLNVLFWFFVGVASRLGKIERADRAALVPEAV